jgi:hypothetical protein
LKSSTASDDFMGDLGGMKDGKLLERGTGVSDLRRRDHRTESGEWRLPSGLQLAEFALRGGFIAPGLLPRLNLPAVALHNGRGMDEHAGRLARSTRARTSRRSGAANPAGTSGAIAVEETL